MIKLNAKELRTHRANRADRKQFEEIKRNPIYIVLDNVLDTYNVGSIFRLADAVAAQQVWLCGETQVPPNTRIKKASINTTEWVEWQYASTAVEAIAKLKTSLQDKQNSKLKIVAIEQNPRSIPYTQMKWEFPVAVVVGNETNGVLKEVLEMCDTIVELPMFGVNRSLNVMVSLGIVLYEMLKGACPELAEG